MQKRKNISEDKPEVGLDKSFHGPSMGVFSTNHPLRLEALIIEQQAMSSSQIENDFSSNENTLSSFFRTAGGDLISTENCKEGMRTEIWKKDWKGTKKLPLEAHIQRL